MSATIYRHDYLKCPRCEEESGCRVDHLYGNESWRKAGPWSCRACGAEFTVEIEGPRLVSLTLTGKFSQRNFSLLKLKTADGTLFAVFKGHGEASDDQRRYFYEEHSCLTNWAGEMEECFLNGETDPHGVFEFVRSVPAPLSDDGEPPDWLALFPEIKDSK